VTEIKESKAIVDIRRRPGPVLPSGGSIEVFIAVSNRAAPLLNRFEYTPFSVSPIYRQKDVERKTGSA